MEESALFSIKLKFKHCVLFNNMYFGYFQDGKTQNEQFAQVARLKYFINAEW